MIGPLERVILSGLHEKAQAADLDLNDIENFLKFSMVIDKVAIQAKTMVESLVANARCGCSKKKASVDSIHTTETTSGKSSKPTPEVEIVEVVE